MEKDKIYISLGTLGDGYVIRILNSKNRDGRMSDSFAFQNYKDAKNKMIKLLNNIEKNL